MKKTDPIAVFDSGVGGISVLKELIALMPNENFIYYGDSINAPYGTKSADEIRALTRKNAEILLEKGAKAIVIAHQGDIEVLCYNGLVEFRVSLPGEW